MKPPLFTDNGNHFGISAVCRLRRLIAELIREVELIDYGHAPSAEIRFQETGDNINFYEEVSRFEIAMIKTALHRTQGNQRFAARFLNLNSSTLNAKIKQYDIKPDSHPHDPVTSDRSLVRSNPLGVDADVSCKG